MTTEQSYITPDLEGEYKLYITTEKEKLILATDKHKGGRIRIIDWFLSG